MKKFFACLLLIFLASANTCFAFSELYYFKQIKTNEVEPIVSVGITEQGYNIIKQNPYYVLSPEGDDAVVIVLQQSGDNMFYYYRADKNNKINKAILKEIKKRDIVCEQSFNTSIIGVYDNIAQELIANSGMQKQYTFNDEQVILPQSKAQPKVQKPDTYSGYIAQVSAGTKFNVYLQNAINTSVAKKGDAVSAVITDNIMYNGVDIIPQGSVVYGELSAARSATYGSRNGRVVINFNKIVTPDNNVYDISAEQIDFTVSNEGKITSSAKSALTKAAVGALAGMLFALMTDNNVGRSAAIGAGVGAGSSIIYSAAEKGVDAEIPSYTEIELTLTKPFNISVSR